MFRCQVHYNKWTNRKGTERLTVQWQIFWATQMVSGKFLLGMERTWIFTFFIKCLICSVLCKNGFQRGGETWSRCFVSKLGTSGVESARQKPFLTVV